jgi:hypothetical protein
VSRGGKKLMQKKLFERRTFGLLGNPNLIYVSTRFLLFTLGEISKLARLIK